MKQMKSSIQAMATLLLLGAVLSACSDNLWFQDNNEGTSESETYTMTVQASMCGESTRALSLGESTINASWQQGEAVTVYNVTQSADLEGTLVAKSSGTSTTLKGQLTGTIENGDELKLKFLSPTYSSQDGTLTGNATSIDKVCDYAEATVTVSSITDGYVITTGSASFTNQQTIVKFTLLDKGNGNAAINPSSLTVSDGTSTVCLFDIPADTYTTNGNGVLYVAFPASGTAKTISLNVIGGSKHYFYEKSDVTFTNGNFYNITAKLGSIGVLPGKFTINAGGGQVSFSQGNLQYQASTSTWRFAMHQYDYVGNDNANISGSYSGWIDLFGWGTGNNPTISSTNNNDYGTFTDWGTNAISNGGNTADLWQTLTKDEWAYLFNNRTNAANLRTFATVNDVVGLILMPDGWTADGVSLTITTANYTSNIISLADWNRLESQGCVFLPSAGYRGGTTLDLVQDHGSYWSSMPYESNHAYYLDVKTNGLDPNYQNNRYIGLSVRLVYEMPYFLGSGTEADPYRISSQADWNYLAIKVNSGTSYAGKFFRQTANINVTTMVGNSSDSKPFSGTYDGYGKTLNLNLSTLESHAAPFRFIENASIKNVVTTGTVYSTVNHPSGLVGITHGACTIQNCRVSANVGGAQHSGGIVGHCHTAASISIIGCVYSGTLSPASGQYTGGIIGWGGDGGGHTMTISNCLFAGSVNGSTSFHPVGIVQNTNNTRTVSNTYYTVAHNLNNEDTHGNSFVNSLSYKGKFARSITAGTGVTVANAGAATVYDVSGITSYGTGILYDGVLYAGNGEEISLTLSHTNKPGFSFSQYTVTGGGSLSSPTSNSPTLTMTDANQTINAEWIPQGAISGKFSVSSTKQVYFSKGNLRATYNGSSWSWAFATNQWDYIGNAAGNTSINGNGTLSGSGTRTVDLFGWVGKSSTWTGAAQYGISNSTATNSTNGYGNNASEALKSDWGNTISSGWRTLTSDEWTYIFDTRSSGCTINGEANIRYAHANINTNGNSVEGVILFPDGVTIANSEATSWGYLNRYDNYSSTSQFTTTQWTALAAKGCVFLPAAGRRSPNGDVYLNGSLYWSSSSDTSNVQFANYLMLSPTGLSSAYHNYRYIGASVRLVYDVN